MTTKSGGMLVVDIRRCLACRSCELACAVEHSVSKKLPDALREDPRPVSRVKVVSADGAAVPLQCRHCEDPPCVAVCPRDALEKLGPGLPVIIKDDRCIGCKFCVMVCPFGVITMRQDGKLALKCDLCVTRQAQGRPPACVEACPTGAIQHQSVEEAAAGKRHEAAQAAVGQPESSRPEARCRK